MPGLDKLENVKHGPHVVEFQPWQSVIKTITSPMITALGGKDNPDSLLSIGFAYITTPDMLGGPTHEHPFDQWIFLIGADGRNFLEFDAEAEMFVGDKYEQVNFSCYFFVPRGTPHCPLHVIRVGKPIIFIDARIPEEASVRPVQ